MSSDFEVLLKECPHDFKMAIIRVCDTCEMARRWLDSQKIKYTAADVLRLAEMIEADFRRDQADRGE